MPFLIIEIAAALNNRRHVYFFAHGTTENALYQLSDEQPNQ